MMQAQFVTVPILDARLQELRADTRIALMGMESKLTSRIQELDARLERTKAELVRWVFLVMLGNVALSVGATALLNAFK